MGKKRAYASTMTLLHSIDKFTTEFSSFSIFVTSEKSVASAILRQFRINRRWLSFLSFSKLKLNYVKENANETMFGKWHCHENPLFFIITLLNFYTTLVIVIQWSTLAQLKYIRNVNSKSFAHTTWTLVDETNFTAIAEIQSILVRELTLLGEPENCITYYFFRFGMTSILASKSKLKFLSID